MLCIFSPYTDCYSNIASEEFLLSDAFSDSIFFLYKNSPSVIVGCNQNTFSEINHDYVKENNIQVVKRLSGGGAVYHDFGNLNYGFIFKKNDGSDDNIDDIFKKYTQPILNVLHSLGVNAVFSGRNDLTIENKKFSGNAQYHTSKKVLIHGTLLFNSNLSILSQALHASPLKFVDKSVKSIASRVTNIEPYLRDTLTIDQFSYKILQEIQSLYSCDYYTYTSQDKETIEKLSDKKYSTWEWNFGSSPQFTLTHTFKFSGGTVDLCLIISSGTIEKLKIYGDFFGDNSNIGELEESFKGLPYALSNIETLLKNICICDYIGNLTNEEFCREMFSYHPK